MEHAFWPFTLKDLNEVTFKFILSTVKDHYTWEAQAIGRSYMEMRLS